MNKRELLAHLLAEETAAEVASIAAAEDSATPNPNPNSATTAPEATVPENDSATPNPNPNSATTAPEATAPENAQDGGLQPSSSEDSNASSVVPEEDLVPPSADHLNPAINVNDQILVWFPKPGRWYGGVVRSKTHPRAHVEFLDNTKEWVHVRNNKIRIAEGNDTSK